MWYNVYRRLSMSNIVCSVNECNNLARARGLCTNHYAMWFRRGTTSRANTSGKNNPMYKHGKYCEPSLCECGRKKDRRSQKCAICRGVSYPVGEKEYEYSKYDISENQIKDAVANANSYTRAADILKLPRSELMRRLDGMESIDVSHFICGRGRPLDYERVFTANSKIAAVTVRKYLLKYRLMEYICARCKSNPVWMETTLVLQLHHINGNSKDHRLENIEWLCPNCHSQTDTYVGKNSKKKGTKQ